ncbi:MAG: Xaa-Pro peptidase family protein [Gemmatimonadota bacterium]|jgi:Xaa-Pro aminopeptidase
MNTTTTSRRRVVGAQTTLLTALLAGLPPIASAQTPEQRYGDWVTPVFQPDEYAQRRSRMLEALSTDGGGIFIVPSAEGSPGHGTFRQSDDFWYLTGLEVPASFLVLDADNGTATLFMPPEDARFRNEGRPNDFPGMPQGDDPELVAMAGVSVVSGWTTLIDSVTVWNDERRSLLVNLGHAGDMYVPTPPLMGTLTPAESLVLGLHGLLSPRPRIDNAFQAVARVRMVKSPAEVDALRRAAQATTEAIRATAAVVRPGVDERTLRGVFEAACRANGAQAIPFTPIIKSGPNSLWPWRILAAFYDRRNRTLEAGELVILDVGCEVDGYVSDVGRTFPVSGRFNREQVDILGISTRAAEAIIAAARPGVTLADLTRAAYASIPDGEERYMQTPSYFGHHIGLSTGDPALMDAPLEPGMVFTVEPWYYNHETEIAVFVEDVVVITEDGAEVITRSLPRDPRALEALMRTEPSREN